MIAQTLEYMNHKYDLCFYSNSYRNDHITARLKSVATQFVRISHMSHEVIAKLIRNHEIDIVFELSGHSEGNCLKAVAQRPALVIIKWVGSLFNTSRLPFIDYLISDDIEKPLGRDKFYTENLIRMSHD